MDNSNENSKIKNYLTLDELNLNEYDFVDFGCSNGGSLDYVAIAFGGNGVGIDIDFNKVLNAKKHVIESKTGNHQVVQGDITMLNTENFKNTVRYASCKHFLEHIDGFNVVENILQNAINISTDFIFIIQPFFDKNTELFEKGFKLAYSHWTGHPNLLTSFDFFRLCESLPIKDFIIFARTPIVDSNDDQIVPLDAPIDSLRYDENIHSKKDFVTFEGLYREIGVFMLLKDDVGSGYLDELFNKIYGEKKIIYDSRRYK